MNSKKKIYISGKISHSNLDIRKQAFRKAEDWLEENGYLPINPFYNGVPEDASYKEHMKADIKMLLDCDGILMLDGWTYSHGAALEFSIATVCGLKVIDYCFRG